MSYQPPPLHVVHALKPQPLSCLARFRRLNKIEKLLPASSRPFPPSPVPLVVLAPLSKFVPLPRAIFSQLPPTNLRVNPNQHHNAAVDEFLINRYKRLNPRKAGAGPAPGWDSADGAGAISVLRDALTPAETSLLKSLTARGAGGGGVAGVTGLERLMRVMVNAPDVSVERRRRQVLFLSPATSDFLFFAFLFFSSCVFCCVFVSPLFVVVLVLGRGMTSSEEKKTFLCSLIVPSTRGHR